jgi:formylglycine-generating enzyme required for sulfatase activity
LRIQAVLDEVNRRRDAGEDLADAAVCDAHSDLMPDLASALELARGVRQQYLAARTGQRGQEGSGPRRVAAAAGEPPVDTYQPRIDGYRVQRLIGRGGQAAVFLAVQETTRRAVAIKVISGGAYLTSRSRARFEAEVRALAALDHPGVVRIVDRGRAADGSFYLVTDYVEGVNLDAYLSDRRREGWTALQVAGLFAKVARAVEAAHRRGILHRDLKPSNVQVDGRGEPRVLDFGLARLTAWGDDDPDAPAARGPTATGHVLGSLCWASPEQASGDLARLGPPSDVYALAVALYHALVGDFPYDVRGTVQQVTRNICRTPPRPPPRRAGHPRPPFGRIDDALAALLLQALDKDPARRPADAGQLAAGLEACAEGRPLPASPGRRTRWGPRAAGATALAATALVVLGVIRPPGTGVGPGRDDARAVAGAAAADPEFPTFISPTTGLVMVRLPRGAMLMGSGPSEAGRRANETARPVTLTRPFFVGRTEVTRGQYRRVMGGLPAALSGTAPDTGPANDDDDLPVERVSRPDAEEFCRRLGRLDARAYRLPTEAEWEYACRAGTPTPYAGGGPADAIAWHAGNSGGVAHRVAGRRANPWGLYDMHGGVAEWCRDGYVARPGHDAAVDPVAPPDATTLGCVRGGSYLEGADACRAAARAPLPADQGRPGVGFRVVTDATPPSPAGPDGTQPTGGPSAAAPRRSDATTVGSVTAR